ncbi:MAG TPA: L,D-transpeptidase family protein [Anaerolineales bacterium]|jgi:lipoprotein-anchoring transpeptidase ErfK/SrfK|nr:L,D-transpeptidase family protein [Anaerolineales bacterium]
MNNQFIEARELIVRAREALRHGDKISARQMGERAAYLAPEMEDVWLVLAASDHNPQDALAYARKALQINPNSTRAQRAVEWAAGRLNPTQVTTGPVASIPQPVPTAASLPNKHAYQTAVAMPALKVQGRNWLPALLIGAGVLFIGFILFVLVASPMLSSMVKGIGMPFRAQEKLWAEANIPKPETTPLDGNSLAVQAADTLIPTLLPARATATPTSEATSTTVPTEEATVLPAATDTPGVVAMEVLADTPTSVAPTPGISVGDGERWIDVDLTNQMVYAYEGETVVNSFLVSTGTWLTPTVTGEYKIYVKYRSASMSGPGYYLTDVPYIMYFYKSYGLHGTYWHNNFGTPMSHGCVNLRTDEAAWLFDWASVGTVVNVHY